MTDSSPATPTILEEGQRLSNSLLWHLQRAYYAESGLGAWRDGIVPFYITNNPYLAKAYAKLILAWLHDLVANTLTPIDPAQPIYLLELGAGSGQLAFHFLKHFHTLIQGTELDEFTFIYVLTDYSPTVIHAWQNHPQLQQLAATGQMDFARFDLSKDAAPTLIQSGVTLNAQTLKNPLAVIGNYFFDSLPQDAFLIEKGQVSESLVTLAVPGPVADPADPKLLKQIQATYRHQPISGDYYPEPAFNEILRGYQHTLEQTQLLFPINALQCLHSLRQLSNGHLLVLAGDKGIHHLTDLDNRGDPTIAVHGSISMSVNFHALGEYALNQGGQFLCTPHRRVSLDVCALVFDPSSQPYPETARAYDLVIIEGGPDDFFTLKKVVEGQYQNMDLPQLLAYLRLSGWDSNVFIGCFITLLGKLPEASDAQRQDVDLVVDNIWQNYYFLGEEKDLPYALGLVLTGIRNYVGAINYFQVSLSLHGPDSSTLYYLAVCHYQAGEPGQALTYATQSIEANADFEPAQTLKLQIETELADSSPSSNTYPT